MAKILGICGSPRKGATLYALEAALEAAAAFPEIETELWSIRGKKIAPCVHCDRCIREKTMCHIQDDLQEIEAKVLEADALLIATPVYDMSITSQLAALLNRLRPMYLVYPGHLRNKVGGGIAVGGTRHGGQEMTLLALSNFFMMHEMLVTGGYGGCYTGGTIWSKDNRAHGAEEDTVGMDTVIRLGQAVAEATLVTSLGRQHTEQLLSSHGVLKASADPLRDH